MIGTRLMSGSAATRFRNVTIASFESSNPSSMLMSMICAPLATCCRATSSAASKSPDLIRPANRGDPVTFVRSPMFTNPVCGEIVSASRPLSRVYRSISGIGARGVARDGRGDCTDVCGRRTAATPDDVEETALSELTNDRSHLVRCLVILPKLVW